MTGRGGAPAGWSTPPPAEPYAIPVRIAGLLRGSELSGDAVLTLVPPHLEVSVGRRLVVLRLASFDGVEVSAEVGFLHLSWGDVLELRAQERLDDFAAALAAAAQTLPELTTSLRSYGSPRAGAGADQEAFFAPLRGALERAREMRDVTQSTAVFASDQLAAEVERHLARMAARRFPAHPPERRALEAELADCAAEVLRRLGALGAAQRTLDRVPDSLRFAAWRQWRNALLDVFSTHDSCWPRVRAALGAATVPAEEPRRTRRWRPFGSSRRTEDE